MHITKWLSYYILMMAFAQGIAHAQCGTVTELGSSLGNVSNGSTTGGTNVFSAQGLGATAPVCWLDYYNQSQSSSGPDKLFHWTAPATAGYTFSTCGSNYDTGLLIYDYTCPTAPVNPDDYICGNDDDPRNTCGVDSYIECLQLAAGQEIFIVVDGWNGASGNYVFNITQCAIPCSGSNSTTATAITSLPYTHSGSTVGECDDDTQTSCGSNSSSPDFWYSLNLSVDVELTAYTTCGSQYLNTKLAVLNSSLTQLICNDDAAGCGTLQSSIENFPLAPGNYFIVVDGANNAEGTYELHVDTVQVDPPAVPDLLPDIIVRVDDLYDWDIQGNLLRMSNGTANIGLGRLHLFGGQDNGNGTQQVIQRVFRSDGSFWDRTAGNFVYHAGHSHIHVEDWDTYKLREVLPGNGVGDIIATGSKTSFCILDLAVYNNSLPNFDGSHYNSCSSTTQGLSVGYVDIYGKTLAGQSIDITGIPGGTYWLESEVDPNNNMLESNEANNITRIQVTIAGGPPGIVPDAYENNNSTAETLSRLEGAANSPNLGPCNPQKIISGLNIHAANNEDFFRFYMNHTGGAGDFVRINFLHSQGDIDMRLLNSGGSEVAGSNGSSNQENISLSGRAEGFYYIRIFGYNGATNPDYTLTIDPPSNAAPTITVVNPPAGDVTRIHGSETYDATWTFSDPENDLGWVTLYMNTIPALNGNEILLETSLNTQASIGVHTINSAYVPIGTYWVYASATDGGSTVGDWSAGTISFVDPIPDPIEDLTIYHSGDDIILRWGIPLDGSHHFAIYTRDISGGPATPLVEVDSVYSYTHVGAAIEAPLKFYYVTVLGHDD